MRHAGKHGGSHVQPEITGSYNKKPKRRRAQHIRQVAPAPSSTEWESEAMREKRLKRGSYVEEKVKRHHRKNGAAIATIAIIAVVVALAVGVYAFFKSTDSRLTLTDETATEALAKAKDGEPYYVLCTADLRSKAHSKSQTEDLAYMVVRVDEQSHKLSFVSIPPMLSIEFPDGEFRNLADAYDSSSDGDIIRAISKFCGVDISHYITTDAESIFKMVELVGGVNLDVAQEVDDPRAGNIVLDVGEQALNGASSLVLLKATNLQGGFETTASNRVAFTMQLLGSALDSNGLGFASIVSDASDYIDTDMSTSDLLAKGDLLRPFDEIKTSECVTPFTATKSISGDSVIYKCSQSEWESMMDAVRSSADFTDAADPEAAVGASDVTVEVRNGTSINGAAASLANMLSELGYQILGTGNTGDGITYPETLIVYTDPAYSDAAKAIVRDVGIGRVVNGGDFYASDAGIIAIIGADWAN